MANRSDAPKIQVSFHLLMFAHLGGCLWCEGEGLSHCVEGKVHCGKEIRHIHKFTKKVGPICHTGKFISKVC